MTVVGLKWRVNRAVRASALPATSRLLMFVLSDMADSATAEIPVEHTPSVSQLAAETGLSEPAIRKHRASLEALGWLLISRPTVAEAARHVSSRYSLMIGNNPPGGNDVTPEIPDPGQSDSPTGGNQVSPESEPTGGNQETPESESGGNDVDPAGETSLPPRGKPRYPLYKGNDPLRSDDLNAADAAGDSADALFDLPAGAAKPGSTRKANNNPKPKGPASVKDPEAEARNKIAADITREWWVAQEIKPTLENAFVASQRIVFKLIEAGHLPDAVAEAARRSGFSLTTAGMEFQLKRISESAAGATFPRQRHQVHQNYPDQSIYDIDPRTGARHA